jgi:hypothetical protein
VTEAETIARLVGLLEARTRFVHVRFGDGDVFFATGTGPKLTGDGETWSPLLRARLQAAWRRFAVAPNLLLGDVGSYDVSDGCEAQWQALLAALILLRGVEPELVHIEALRAGRGHALPFYAAAAQDRREKVFVGPERLAGAARMLGAAHVLVPLAVAHEDAHRVAQIVAAGEYEVAFFAAGRGGKIMQAILTETAPWLTHVDVGSGLDVLFTDLRRGTDRGVDVEKLRSEYLDAGLAVT